MNIPGRLLGLSIAAALVGLSAPVLSSTGEVTHLSGTLSVRKSDGSVRILAQRSEIQSGDTLNTERDSYAQVKFPDGGQLPLKPNTSVKLDDFRFAEEKPQDDAFLFSLVKGGLRAITGLVGRRSRDKYQLTTATATVGIRGTTFSADDCESSACGSLQAGVYVSVADGEVVVQNSQGELALAAGQFGLVERNQRPLFLSTDPGIAFTPPATFLQSVMAGQLGRKYLECVVATK